MSDPATEYAVDELVVATMARCFSDTDQATTGMASWLPVCALELARRTHAPDLVWIAGGIGLDPGVVEVDASTVEAALWRDAVMYVDPYMQFWDFASHDRFLRTFCVGAAQLDQFGNANNSVIGSYRTPKVRLPGTAGLGDMGSMDKRLVYWQPRQSPRSLVERVDFRSAIGYLDGYGERARLGIGGGPALVVTDLAVFDFEPESQRMRLQSVHPGVTRDRVLAAMAFEPVLPEVIPETPAPTQEQVDLLREVIDPAGRRKREFAR